MRKLAWPATTVWSAARYGQLPLLRTVTDGAVALLYDATVGVVGSPVTQWVPARGGTASDVLVPTAVGREPLYTPNNPVFGGRPSVGSDLTKHLLPTVPATAALVVQPYYLVLVATVPPAGASYCYMCDGAVATDRGVVNRNLGGNWGMFAGVHFDTGIPVPAVGSGVMLTAYFNGAASTLRCRTAAGLVFTSAAGNTSNFSLRGLTLFAQYVWGTRQAATDITVAMAATSLSAADQARLDRWCQLAMRWS